MPITTAPQWQVATDGPEVSTVVQMIYVQTVRGNQPLCRSPCMLTYGLHYPAPLAVRYGHVPGF